MAFPLESVKIVLLIFGGCCSNVFALEAIVRSEPSSGLLITFLQFFFTALTAYPSQIGTGSSYALKNPQIPIRRWTIIAAMHFGINMLNNWAFSYNISVPVHIILRSFGSVTTMIAGFLRGKRYSPIQVLSVVLLTVGVLTSAWADAESKGSSMSMDSDSSGSEFVHGLGILVIAQFLSAYMGAYHEDTYVIYGANWKESLFYSHFLCLPLFLPMSTILREQYSKLAQTAPLSIESVTRPLQSVPFSPEVVDSIPQGLLFLTINILTQLVCISGVNLLCAKSSAVTVTIVLNIRKLVSFIFSTMLFGHHLSTLMIFGSALVFGSGALYGWETSWRLPQQRKSETEQNGHLKCEKQRQQT